MVGIEPASEAEAALRGRDSDSDERERKEHVIDENEMKLMDNLFDFSDLRAREIMLPRTDMDVLFTNYTLEENLRIVNETKHSRYPVATDNKDRIIGFVHITDLLLAEPEKQRDLASLMRPIMDVSESTEISEVLRKMQARHEQLALVVDEYGGRQVFSQPRRFWRR